MFALTTAEIGRPIQDLKISYRPVEIRSSIDQAYAERLPITIRDVEWHSSGGETLWLDVLVVPLMDAAAGIIGASITFTDVSASKRLQRELEHATQELETAYEELQSTNEELETTNEELQSTVEELETTNEELQSTNEELRPDEVVGRNILNIDIGLPIERLKQPLRDCLSGAREYIELQLDATNRRGRSILCRVTCSPLLGFQLVVRGVIVVMEDLEVESPQPRRELRGKRPAERQVES